MKTNNNFPRVRRSLIATCLAFGYFTTGLAPAYASDTEIYSQTALQENSAPMVMLNLDASNSMNMCLNSTSTCAAPNRRVDALKRSMRKILYGNTAEVAANPAVPVIAPAPGHLRVGLGLIQTDGSAASEGWKIRHPVRRLDDVIGGGFTEVRSAVASNNQDIEQQSAGLGTMYHDTELNLASTDSVGLHFRDLRVPRGATIESAYIEFTASATTTGDPAWRLRSEASDNAEDYATTGPNHGSRSYNDVRQYNSTPADPAEVDSDVWTAGKQYHVRVRRALQDVVDRSGWCGGNAVAFRISDDPDQPLNLNTRRVWSHEGKPALAPKLVVTYSMTASAAADTCIRQDFTRVIGLTSEYDDIDWREGGSNADVDASHANLAVANVSSSLRLHVGLRFPGVDVSPNAQITSAKLFMVSSQACTTGNGACSLPNLEVAAFTPSAAGGLPAFCNSSGVCTKPDEAALSAAQPWVVGSFRKSLVGSTFSTEVTSLVQNLVNSASWARGNALGFRIRNAGTTNNAGAFFAYKSLSASNAPRLEITGVQTVTSVPVTSVKTVREELMETIDALAPNNNAPGANTYMESARYLLGQGMSAKAASHASTYDSSTLRYISPVRSDNQCSGNYLFYMSGGVPDSSAQSNLVAPTSHAGASNDISIDCSSTKAGTPAGSPLQPWRCSFTTANYLKSGSAQFNTGTSTVTATVKTNTLVLGQPAATESATDFQDAVADMSTLATAGGGTAFTAANEDDLLKSLVKTFEGALDEGASISAPGVAVNQLSRLNHLDELYYSVFDPDTSVFWKGNVKRYRIGFDNGQPTVFDSQNATAIDPVTTFFKIDAVSWWTDPLKPDGRDAAAGGSASQLPSPADRRMYTLLTTAYPSISSSTTPVNLERIVLTDTTFNDAAKTAMGVTDDTRYTNYMNWLLGYDIKNFDSAIGTNLMRKQMGGALHSRPILVNYGYTGDLQTALTNPAQQDNTVYFSTLEGILHAIDTTDGVETFSFIPKEKLATVPALANNGVATEPEYGLDLSWTVVREDKNGDFQITTDGSGDKVWLFGGMRMGGRNYYALDVTNRSAPKLKWTIEGGSTGAFLNMGQTWSQPAEGKVRINGTVKSVLFFGGGYDPAHEATGYLPASGDSLGNQLYIVDAATGQLLWWASSTAAGATSPTLSVPDLKFAVPSEIKTFDYNSDGLVDSLYFGDLGGQVFRADLNNNTTTNAGLGVRVRLLAKLGQTAVASPTVVDQRRFYEAPSVARFTDSAGKYVLVAMGSGYRSRPLQGQATTGTVTNDYFYVLRDNDVVRSDIATGSATATSSGNLQDIIDPLSLANVTLPSGVVDGGVSMTGKMGWMGDLPDRGEKVLASPVIFDGKVYFTSYVPTVVDPNPCAPIYGRTKLWQVTAQSAGLTDTNGDGVIDSSDSPVTDNVVQGVGGEAQLIVLPPDPDQPGGGCGPIVLVGTDAKCSGVTTSGGLKRLRWYNKTKN